jgi:hypothetical protein
MTNIFHGTHEIFRLQALGLVLLVWICFVSEISVHRASYQMGAGVKAVGA